MLRKLVCRVCGIDFVAARFDAKTCSDTCRKRLRRGGEFAYLNRLGMREQRIHREMHASYDGWIAAYRDLVAATKRDRAAKRDRRRQADRARVETEVLANAMRRQLQQQDEHRRRRLRGSVAAVLKLFAQERRDDMSAEAIAAFLNMTEYPPELVADLVEEIKASGEYDEIIAEESARPSST